MTDLILPLDLGEYLQKDSLKRLHSKEAKHHNEIKNVIHKNDQSKVICTIAFCARDIESKVKKDCRKILVVTTNY